MTRFGKILISLVAVVSLVAAIVLWRRPAIAEFESPRRAVTAFVLVLQADNTAAAQAILGPAGERLINTADGQPDRPAIRKFISAYSSRATIIPQGKRGAILEVGKDDWPFPIPLAKGAIGWHFDARAGKRELAARRIGQDELSTIQSCKAFVDAEREYALVRRGAVFSYARRIASARGGTDGLYWPAMPGKPPSPLGPVFSRAEISAPENSGNAEPFHGYYYRILTAQGSSADGGAYGYLARGKMIGGFAVIAYPSEYRVTGVMTFIVNQAGIVFQRDLGPQTPAIVSRIKAYDPGEGWVQA